MTPITNRGAEVSLEATGLVVPALADIFREHGRFVFRVLRHLGVPDSDADDIFQEVFVVMHRKLPEFDPSRSLRSWVYGICVRSAASYRKKQRALRAHTAEECVDDRGGLDQATPPELLDERKARTILRDIVRALPDDKRQVFVLHVIEELPMHEVADALGCPLNTAYSRAYAARKLVDEAIHRARAQLGRR